MVNNSSHTALYHLWYVSPMAIQIAMLLFLLSILATFLNRGTGIVRLFKGSRTGDRIARRYFTILMLMLVVVGLLQHFHILPPEISLSPSAIGLLVTSLVMIWTMANILNKADDQRLKAEEEIKNINATLELKVEERSVGLRDLYAELQKSEERYRSILQNASDAIYITDNTGRIIDMSKSMCEMLGYSSEELLQFKFSDMVDPENLKDLPIELPAIPDQLIFKERTLVTKDGRKINVEINGQRIDKDRLMGVARNITERKMMEAELREAESKFRSLVEKSIVGVYLAGLDTRLLYVNQRFAELFGYEPQELLDMEDKVVDCIYNKENQEIVRKELETRKAAKKSVNHFEIEGIKKNGSSFWLEVYSNAVTIKGQATSIGTVVDITERKRTEAKLLEAELKFRTLSEKSIVGVYIVQNERFIYVNPKLAEIFGYTARELLDMLGRAVDVLFTEEARKSIRENLQARYSGAAEGVSYQVVGVKKDGGLNYLEIHSNLVTIGGKPSFIGTILDITERKKAEDELKISEQKYKLLFESNPLPLWIVAKNDMTVISANAAAAKLYGYTTEELLNMDVKKLRPVKHWGILSESYQKDLNEVTDFGIVQHTKKDGTEILVSIIAQDIVFEGRFARLSSTSDVSEKLKAEESLKTTEANLQTILNNTDTAYALLNADLHVLEYNNKALIFAENEFSFEPGGSNKILDHMPEDRRSQFLTYTKQVFDGHVISYEASYPQEDGCQLWYYIRMFPIADKGHKILGLVLAITDITERKEAERDLQIAYQSIQTHIDKIREMTWKQSHLIRSPLANVKVLFSMMKADPTDEKVSVYIETELERMDKILLDMAKGAARIGEDKPIEPEN